MLRLESLPRAPLYVTAVDAVAWLVLLADWMWLGGKLPAVLHWLVFGTCAAVAVAWLVWAARRRRSEPRTVALVATAAYVVLWQFTVFAADAFDFAVVRSQAAQVGTGVLFFIGLACIVTGLLMLAGILSGTLIAAFGSVAVLSLLFAFALWKPLKRAQNSGRNKGQVKGDFIGHRFFLDQDVSERSYGSYRLSGVDWKVRSETPLVAGTEVEVVRVEVGELTVAACA